jgi:phage shock protein PspC (stress-responsive transcriptional regulator)
MSTLNTVRPADHRENLLGVCAALGDATGVNPIVFRIALVIVMLCGFFTTTVLAYCAAAVAIKVAQR